MAKNRRGFVLLTLVIAGLLAVLSAAYACTNVATLSLDRRKARVGQTVQGQGRSFSTRPDASAVQVHLNSLKGKVLDSGVPNGNGTVDLEFTVPNVKREKHYTIVATQYTKDGTRCTARLHARHCGSSRAASSKSIRPEITKRPADLDHDEPAARSPIRKLRGQPIWAAPRALTTTTGRGNK